MSAPSMMMSRKDQLEVTAPRAGQAVRFYKDARALAWLWSFLLVAALVAAAPHVLSSLAPHAIRYWILPFGTFLGIPLLAVMVFGVEFQHRTFSLLLSQPITRAQLWNEKLRVAAAATLPLLAIYGLAWARQTSFDATADPFDNFATMSALLVAMIAAAPFWTLVGRSALYGMGLDVTFSVLWIDVFAVAWHYLPAVRSEWPVLRFAAALILLCYGAAALWFGRSLFLRIQEGAAPFSGEMTFGSRFVPRFIADGLQPRPSGAIRNVLRKELRLLQPVWLLTLLSMAAWLLLITGNLIPVHDAHVKQGYTTTAQLIAFAFTIVIDIVIAVLAGTVPLGEERTSGSFAAQMTQPLSTRLQWFLKLTVAVAVSVTCAALLPLSILLARGYAAGAPFRYVAPDQFWAWPLGVATITVMAFWSACVINGAVRAALLMFGLGWALTLSAQFGSWLAQQFGVSGAGVLDRLFTIVDPFRFNAALDKLPIFNRVDLFDPRFWLTPVLLLLLVQSYWLFRREPGDEKLYIVRAMIPAAMVSVLCGFCLWGFFVLAAGAYRRETKLLTEIHAAIEQAQGNMGGIRAEHPLQLSGEDLARNPALSPETKQWLANSTITVRPLSPEDARGRRTFWITAPLVQSGDLYRQGETLRVDAAHPQYAGIIHLARGYDCSVHFQEFPRGSGTGGIHGVCDTEAAPGTPGAGSAGR